MAIPKRAAILNKTFKTLQKHYQGVATPDNRSVLEHLLYSCCLENATYEKADEAFAKLQSTYFDWNEVRVTTITELSRFLDSLPDSQRAAASIKNTLQGIFESIYSFDLEFLRKQNIGKSVKELEKHGTLSPFSIAYATQNALGGHAIPLDKGTLNVLIVLGVITEAEAVKHNVPGMERTIPKTKGVVFGSLLHQLGAAFHASPFSNSVRSVILDISPDAKERFPKRATKKKVVKPAEEEKASPTKKTTSKKTTTKPTKKEAKPAKKKTTPTSSSKKKEKVAKKPEKKKTTKKKSSSKQLTKKKPR